MLLMYPPIPLHIWTIVSDRKKEIKVNRILNTTKRNTFTTLGRLVSFRVSTVQRI